MLAFERGRRLSGNQPLYFMPLLARVVLSAAVIGGVGYGIWSHTHKKDMPKQQPAATVSATLTTGTYDNDLEKDMAMMDAQLKLIEQDAAAVDAESTQQKSTQ